MEISAIIVAAGTGSRMKSNIRKQYLLLFGIPILIRTVQAIAYHPEIRNSILVVPPGDSEYAEMLLRDYPEIKSVSAIVEGGITRSESVHHGFSSLKKNPPDLVVIHDGVRPLVEPALISSCIDAAKKYGAAIAAIPSKDTIKRVDQNGFIVETPERSRLWLAETPQVFRYELLKNALTHCDTLISATDDAMLVEQHGIPVKIVEGSENNIKITRAIDIQLAELIWKEKENDTSRYWI